MASSGSAPFTSARAGHRSRVSLAAAVLVSWAAAAVLFGAAPQAPRRAAPYFPPRGEWAARDAAALGFDKAKLDEAVAYAKANENPNDKDLSKDILRTFRREPHNELIGPTAVRGPSSGLIIRRGYVAAQWGDTARPEMTFSVTKTFLSTVVGLAVERGLIRSVDDRVAPYMPASVDLFASEKNAPITWDHLLRQTSDWQGTLYGKPDWADRPEGATPADYPNRRLSAPGERYKYNDVRVNVLALAALHVLRRPLPHVLRESIMDPIGASSTWRWEGYDNSWVDLDGVKVQASTGGGHWGGGMFISAGDMARFGYLFLRNGRWNDRQLVSPAWIAHARTPGKANPAYGYMNWFLNTDRKPIPSAPGTSVTFRGNGQNIIYVDWDNDLIVVVRWLNGSLDPFFGKVLAAIK
ncbi:MAG: beta-lactamase family protein [Acidobacteriota bacterium]|nr:beta-lactamase family protein [Acidobacteriota bacterium]